MGSYRVGLRTFRHAASTQPASTEKRPVPIETPGGDLSSRSTYFDSVKQIPFHVTRRHPSKLRGGACHRDSESDSISGGNGLAYLESRDWFRNRLDMATLRLRHPSTLCAGIMTPPMYCCVVMLLGARWQAMRPTAVGSVHRFMRRRTAAMHPRGRSSCVRPKPMRYPKGCC